MSWGGCPALFWGCSRRRVSAQARNESKPDAHVVLHDEVGRALERAEAVLGTVPVGDLEVLVCGNDDVAAWRGDAVSTGRMTGCE